MGSFLFGDIDKLLFCDRINTRSDYIKNIIISLNRDLSIKCKSLLKGEIMSKQLKVRETLLSELTKRVVDEIEYCLQGCGDKNFCEHLLEELEDDEKKDEMFDRIFDAIKESITLVELKILKDSNEDSGNFHILYKKLHEYFKAKFEDKDVEDLIFYGVYDDETYLIIFDTMPGFVSNPELKHKRMFDDRPKKQQPDFNKIQDAFKV